MRSISSARVLAGVVGDVAVAAGVAEVDAAGQLADDEQVGAGDALLAQRAGADQGRAGPHRAQVGVEAHALAQAEQPLLGARRVGVGGVPLGAADGAEQDRVGGPAGLQHLVGEGGAVGVDRAAADQALVELELSQRLQQLLGRRDDFRADPVAGQDDYARGVAHAAGLYALAGDGLDVEAHVVEDQRLLGTVEDRLGERSPQLLGKLRQERAERDGRGELERLSGGTGRGSSQQRAAENPARRNRASVSSAEAKFQLDATASMWAANSGSAATVAITSACRAMLPSPPHCATRRPPGRSAARRRSKSRS